MSAASNTGAANAAPIAVEPALTGLPGHAIVLGESEPLELASGQRARIDTHMMRQAVDNLVQNAIQAQVAMEDPQRPRTLTLASHGTGREVRIEVRDTGPGIDPTIAPRIFEPLVSTRAFGVGLGLPLVRRIAEQHGGEVDVETVPGEGTVFTIRLPEVA